VEQPVLALLEHRSRVIGGAQPREGQLQVDELAALIASFDEAVA
jgi:hypothetical protein